MKERRHIRGLMLAATCSLVVGWRSDLRDPKLAKPFDVGATVDTRVRTSLMIQDAENLMAGEKIAVDTRENTDRWLKSMSRWPVSLELLNQRHLTWLDNFSRGLEEITLNASRVGTTAEYEAEIKRINHFRETAAQFGELTKATNDLISELQSFAADAAIAASHFDGFVQIGQGTETLPDEAESDLEKARNTMQESVIYAQDAQLLLVMQERTRRDLSADAVMASIAGKRRALHDLTEQAAIEMTLSWEYAMREVNVLNEMNHKVLSFMVDGEIVCETQACPITCLELTRETHLLLEDLGDAFATQPFSEQAKKLAEQAERNLWTRYRNNVKLSPGGDKQELAAARSKRVKHVRWARQRSDAPKALCSNLITNIKKSSDSDSEKAYLEYLDKCER